MHLDFIKRQFPNFNVDIQTESDTETAYIRHEHFEEPIIIYYFPDDHYPYYLKFATQHRDASSEEDLIEYAQSFANAEKAAIEFFENDDPRFGGEIAVSLLDDLTYDGLRNRFGYPHRDLTNFTFTVRAWDTRYCFDGHFEENGSGAIEIIKDYIK